MYYKYVLVYYINRPRAPACDDAAAGFDLSNAQVATLLHYGVFFSLR